MFPPPPKPALDPSSAASVVWALLLLRHLAFALIIAMAGAPVGILSSLPGLGPGMAIFPAIGLAGAITALWADYRRKNHTIGTLGGVAALVGCYPGLFVFGPTGLTLGAVGMLLHLWARGDFKR